MLVNDEFAAIELTPAGFTDGMAVRMFGERAAGEDMSSLCLRIDYRLSVVLLQVEGIAGDDVSVCLALEFEQALAAVGCEGVVGIQKHEELASGGLDAGVSGDGHAGIGRVAEQGAAKVGMGVEELRDDSD